MNVKRRSGTKQDLAIEVWESLDCESVGSIELQKIQEAIGEVFGAGAIDSPASIARLLADEGAVLRHPEVLDFDAVWREQKETAAYQDLGFSSLNDAFVSLRQLSNLRRELVEKRSQTEVRKLLEFARDVRDDMRLIARSETATAIERSIASEVAEWILIWQQTPDLFSDWLDLRIRSSEFETLFPGFRQPAK